MSPDGYHVDTIITYYVFSYGRGEAGNGEMPRDGKQGSWRFRNG
jgi:hypothetical protein